MNHFPLDTILDPLGRPISLADLFDRFKKHMETLPPAQMGLIQPGDHWVEREVLRDQIQKGHI